MSIWTPANKFESDLTVKIEASKFEIRRCELELNRIEADLSNVERQISTFSSCVKLLRSDEARIVILKEYALMKNSIPKLEAQKKAINLSVANIKQTIRATKGTLASLENELSRSKFKLLEFRKRERPSN